MCGLECQQHLFARSQPEEAFIGAECAVYVEDVRHRAIDWGQNRQRIDHRLGVADRVDLL